MLVLIGAAARLQKQGGRSDEPDRAPHSEEQLVQQALLHPEAAWQPARVAPALDDEVRQPARVRPHELHEEEEGSRERPTAAPSRGRRATHPDGSRGGGPHGGSLNAPQLEAPAARCRVRRWRPWLGRAARPRLRAGAPAGFLEPTYNKHK